MLYSSENDNAGGSKKKSRKRKHDALNEYSPKIDIKIESDTDHSSYRKKSKKSKLKHDFSMKLEKSGTDEESFLNAKVKEEECQLKLLDDCCPKDEYEQSDNIDTKPKHKKSKKKKHNKFLSDQSDVEDKVKVKRKKKDKRSESEERQLSHDEPSVLQSDGNVSQAECHSTEDSSTINNHQRKKKKHNKKPCEESKVFNHMEIDDYFSAGETVINSPRKRKESLKNNKLSEQIVFEDELNINNSQSPSEGEGEAEPLASDECSTSDHKSHATNGQLTADSDDERHATSSRATSASGPAPVPAALSRRLAAYVATLSGLAVVQGEGAAPGDEGEGEGEVEAWLVTVPRGVCAGGVRHVRHVDVGERARLKVGARRLEAAPCRAAPRLALLTAGPGGAALRALRLDAALRFHHKLPRRAPPALPPPADSGAGFIPLPATKTRHPLFGADYRASIKIPGSVTEKLQDARRTKKKSKKSKKLDRDESMDVDLDEVDHVKPEKNKKKAKTKLNAVNDDLWRSPRHLAETLFDY